MVESGQQRIKTKALQRLARWPTTSPSSSMTNWSDSRKYNMDSTTSFQSIENENLVQGSLYIIKVKIVTISLFEGWNDDMCCFSVLRSDTGSMRWSEARYLPGDFDAFDAFDEAGNPPVYFWTRYLRIQVPVNWFSLFEEARRRQRVWALDLQQQLIYQQQNDDHTMNASTGNDDDILTFPLPPSSISSLPLDTHNKTDPTSDDVHSTRDVSLSQVRHGSPTIFSNVYESQQHPTANNDYQYDDYLATIDMDQTTSIPQSTGAAFPSSSSSSSIILHNNNNQSPHTPKNDSIIYSPVSSVRHRRSSTALFSDMGNTKSTVPSKDKSLPNHQDNEDGSSHWPNDNSSNISHHHSTRTKSIKSVSIKSLSKHRKSVLGLF
ncbi:uncharacterized protein BX664DRAFT_338006 [Halteromyces radiatus]|uniref:uncharacterized protein n=1 Tax=Halteromyces radiatus TaxID=101107 RepID=UPI00221ED93C|nr:uncharacterized protein BX664DRAFT_338006 [Halteromyces radiatus]KAI8084880.1 hypothetical protein BX664DRAFT_338006 [Halteromyces radiatus]